MRATGALLQKTIRQLKRHWRNRALQRMRRTKRTHAESHQRRHMPESLECRATVGSLLLLPAPFLVEPLFFLGAAETLDEPVEEDLTSPQRKSPNQDSVAPRPYEPNAVEFWESAAIAPTFTTEDDRVDWVMADPTLTSGMHEGSVAQPKSRPSDLESLSRLDDFTGEMDARHGSSQPASSNRPSAERRDGGGGGNSIPDLSPSVSSSASGGALTADRSAASSQTSGGGSSTATPAFPNLAESAQSSFPNEPHENQSAANAGTNHESKSVDDPGTAPEVVAAANGSTVDAKQANSAGGSNSVDDSTSAPKVAAAKSESAVDADAGAGKGNSPNDPQQAGNSSANQSEQDGDRGQPKNESEQDPGSGAVRDKDIEQENGAAKDKATDKDIDNPKDIDKDKGDKDHGAGQEKPNVAKVRGHGQDKDKEWRLESREGTKLSRVTSRAADHRAAVPAGVHLPAGMVDFTVQELEPGEATTVTMLLPEAERVTTYVMFGPTPEIRRPHWYEFTYDGETGAEIFEDRIVLHFVDGQRGDADLMANGEIVDPGAPGNEEDPGFLSIVTVEATDATASEQGSDAAEFTFTRTGDASSPLTLYYYLAGSTDAAADYALDKESSDDFYANDGISSVTFPAGVDSLTLAITPSEDSIKEDNETVEVNLVYPPQENSDDSDSVEEDGAPNDAEYAAYLYGYKIGVNATAAATVSDNDNATVIHVTTATASIEESSTNSVVFQIARTGDNSEDVTVYYQVAGDAEPGVDYTGLPNYDLSNYEEQGSVTIPAGSSSVTVALTPKEDALVEGDESIVFALSSSTSYVVGAQRSASTRIARWNSAPEVSITAMDANASELGSDPASFAVTRTGDTSLPLTVHYIVSGTATPGWDYAGLLEGSYYYGYYPYQTGSVTIPAGSASTTLTITPFADGYAEGWEDVTVTLTTSYYNYFGYYDYYNYWYYDPYYFDYGYYDQWYYGYGYYDYGYYNYGHYTGGYYGYGYYGYDYYMRYYGGSNYVIGAPSSATATIADNEAVVTVTASDPFASEMNADPGVFTFSRTGDTSYPLTVYYNVYGSARAGVDYTGIEANYWGYGYYGNYYGYWDDWYYDYQTRSVTIPAGSSNVDVTIAPLSDDYVEGTESVSVSLAYGDYGYYDYYGTYGYRGYPGYYGYWWSSPGYAIGWPSWATVYVTDTANAVTIQASDPTANEEGLDPGVFTITRSGNVWSSLTVYYAVAGAAEAYSDYWGLSRYWDYGDGFEQYSYGEITIPAGSTSVDMVVTPYDDALVEGTESVVVSLLSDMSYGYYGYGYYDGGWYGSSRYTVGTPSSATVAIGDNEVVNVVSIQATDAEATEAGLTTGQFTVTRTGSMAYPLEVLYTVSGTATWSDDFAGLPGYDEWQQSGSVTIPAGSAVVTITIIPVNDSVVETDETVTVALAPGGGCCDGSEYTIGSPSNATVTIEDDDVLPVVTIEATAALASEAGPTNGQFTVTRTGSTAYALNVSYTFSGTATWSDDFSGLPGYDEWIQAGTVTIPAGSTAATITVTPVDDFSVEPNETVTLTVTPDCCSGSDYTIGSPSNAMATIEDDDVMPVVTIQATDAIATEAGPTAGQFTVTRTGSTGYALEVGYTFSGTATWSDDFSGLPGYDEWMQAGSVTIPIGSSSALITVTPVDDFTVETDETVALTLSSSSCCGSEYTVGSPSIATVTIDDDDITPEVTIEATDPTATEAGPTVGQFTVTRSSSAAYVLEVSYTLGGTATWSDDFLGLPNYDEWLATGTVTIPAGSTTATITLNPVDDMEVEDNETVALTLVTDGGSQYTVGSPSSASVTIADNDVPSVTITASAPTGKEAGPLNAQYTVTRGVATSSPLTVYFSVTGGTAASGSDYVDLSGSVVIPGNEYSAQISVTPIDDSLPEQDETVIVTLSTSAGYTVGSSSQDTVEIEDDDIQVAVSTTDDTAKEAGFDTGQFTITRTGAPSMGVSVSYTAAGSASGDDYWTLPGTVWIPAGQTSGVVTVYPINDIEVEPTESVVLSISPAAAYTVATPSSATLNILDDDTHVTVEATQPNASEQGPVNGTFTVTRSGDLSSDLVVNFDYSSSGTATPEEDFQTTPSSVTIAAGMTSTVVTIVPIDDVLSEGTESVWLTLSGSDRYTLGSPSFAIVEIADNEPVVSIAATADANEEGLVAGAFTVTRTGGNQAAELIVTYAVSSSLDGATQGIDYTSLTGALVFAAGSPTATIVITPIEDAQAEPAETVYITLESGTTYARGNPWGATIRIADNEPTVEIVATQNGKEEGLVSGLFAVTRSGGNLAAALTVEYDVTGTATSGSDYVALSGSVTIPAGAASTTIAVTPLQDVLPEDEELAVLSLKQDAAESYHLGGRRSGTVNIVDNDPKVEVTTSFAAAAETPVNGQFRVARSKGDMSLPLTVHYTVSGTAVNGEDYVTLGGTVTIPAQSVQSFVTVTPRDDSQVEPSETVTLALTPHASYVLGDSTSADVTIADNDSMVTVEASDASAAEQGLDPGVFTIRRSPDDTTFALTVKYSTWGTAAKPSDYTLVPDGQVTIPVGATTATVVVNPADDTLGESDETITLSLQPGSYRVGNPSTATVIIADNEPVVTIVATDANAAEQDLDPGMFTVTREAADLSQALTVTYWVSGATAGSDYQSLPGSVTIPAGSATQTIVVTPIDDAVGEGVENVTLELTKTAISPYRLGTPNVATVVIADNEPEVSIEATIPDAWEEGSVPGEFTITRSGGNLASPLTVLVAVQGTALNGTDYAALSTTEVTIPSGANLIRLAVTPIDDALGEVNESVLLKVQIGQGYRVVPPHTATVTIHDNEPLVSIAKHSDAAESGPTTGRFLVSRTQSSSSAVTVYYSVAGTATSGNDYAALAGSVTLNAGQASTFIDVVPVNDSAAENPELVRVNLTAHSSYYLASPNFGELIIDDNDPRVTVAASRAWTSESDLEPVTFTATRAFGNTLEPLTVSYSIGGDAVADDDYGALSGVVTIPVGERTAQIVATPIDDDVFEQEETIVVTLTPGPYEIGDSSSANVKLIDNEHVVTIQATVASVAENSPTPAVFTITRSGNPAYDLVVSYSVQNFWGNATPGSDYVALPGTITIPAGQTSVTLLVSPLEDTIPEETEYVRLTINGGTNNPYRLGASAVAAVEILDNEPVVTITATDSQAAETGEDPGLFTVTRSGGDLSLPLTASYAVWIGSASDFRALSGSVVILAGQTTATISLVPYDDNLGEGDEIVTLQLQGFNKPYRVGTPSSASVTIIDNEPLVWIAATDPQAFESNVDPAVFTVTRVGDLSQPLVVNYSVGFSPWESGATAGADYLTLPGNITIPAGASTATMTITPIDDGLAEQEEILRVTLAYASFYRVDSLRQSFVARIVDNEPTVTIVDTDTTAAEQGLEAGAFTVTRSGSDLSAPLTVKYTVSGTANSGTDYVALTGSVVIPAASASASIVVTPVNDSTPETSETVRLDLASDNTYRLLAPTSGVVNIADNDQGVRILTNSAFVREDGVRPSDPPPGNSQPIGLVFTRIGGDASAPIAVTYTVGGTATPNSDYAALTGSVTIPAQVNEVVIPIEPFGDPAVEPIETIQVSLAAGAYAIDGTGVAELPLYDSAAVSISAVPGSVAENGAPANFVFSRAASDPFDLTVRFAVSGYAIRNTDYNGFTSLTNGRGSIVIPSGQSSVSIPITPLDDAVFEGHETVIVTLTEGSYAFLPQAASATLTILDNETVVSIQATDNQAAETGADPGVFTVTRTGSTVGALTVSYTIGNSIWFGTHASEGMDYQSLSRSVTIPAGQSSATITVTPINDDNSESNELVQLVLVAGAGYVVGAQGSDFITIVDDEPVVTIQASDSAAAEQGLDPGIFTVTRTGSTSSALTVEYSIDSWNSNQATPGSDFETLSGIVTIPAGAASANITVTPIDDHAPEAVESVTVRLTSTLKYRVGTPYFAAVTIADNEPAVTIEATDSSAAEEGSDPATFTVRRTGATTNVLTVTYAIGGTAVGDGDYLGLTGTVTIPSGAASTTITVTPREDILAESAESVILTLNGVAGYALGTPNSATVNIVDNEPTVVLQATDPDAAEAGADVGIFTVSRNGVNPNRPLTIHYTVAGTATTGNDYTGVPLEKAGSVTIPAGATNATVIVTPINDTAAENLETIQLTLFRNTTYSMGADFNATVSLVDNDPVVTITSSPATGGLGGRLNPIELMVDRAGDTSSALTVNYTVGGSASPDVDYAALSGTVTIPARATRATIYVVPIDDLAIESGETVIVSIAAGSYIIGTQNSATVTLPDDDYDMIVNVVATDSLASEEENNPGVFTIERNGNISVDTIVYYGVMTSGFGSSYASPGEDYIALPGSITIPAGQSAAAIQVVPIDDGLGESTETVMLFLRSESHVRVGKNNSASVTISDNDPVITIEVVDPNASEQGTDPGLFRVTRNGSTTNDLTVHYSVSSGIPGLNNGWAAAGSDYVQLPGTITIPAGQSSATIQFTPIDDLEGELNEQLRIQLSGKSHYVVGSANNAVATITDNEPVVTIQAADAVAEEQELQGGQFVVTRQGGDLSSTLAVSYNSGGTATADADYVGFSGRVTIPAGETSVALNVVPVDDLLGELEETVSITLTGGHYRIGSGAAPVRIVDNDPVVSISVSDAVTAENGPDPAQFTISRTGGDLSAPLTVLLVTSGQATSGQDYAALPFSVEIPATQTSTTLFLTPVADTQLEGSESVEVMLKRAAYRVALPNSASVKIIDDYPYVSVSATDAHATEGGSNTGKVTFTRNNTELTLPLTVSYTISGTATAGSDYQVLGGTIEIPAGSASAAITIAPLDNTEWEPTESVIVTVSEGGYVIVDKTATVDIQDNESAVSILATQPLADEQGLVPARFTVTRTGGDQTVSLTVNVSLSGTAGPGDYTTSTQESIVIPANQSSATIEITPVDDALAEASESIVATLQPGPYRLPQWWWEGTSSAQGNIRDNEPFVSIAATVPTAKELGPVPGVVTVTRAAGNISGELVVTYQVSGTATAGVDYQSVTGTVTITAGQTSAPIEITPIVDGVLENDETVVVTLVQQESYSISMDWWTPNSATVNILDGKPVVSVQATDLAAAEDGTDPGQFTVSRLGSTTQDLVVYYTLPKMGAFTGIADADYTGLAGYIVIPAGSSSATIQLVPIDDILSEFAEDVWIALSSHQLYRLDSAASTAAISIADDEPTVQITATDANAAEEGLDPGMFTITRTDGDWSQPLAVLYSVAGSARIGQDFGGVSVLGVDTALIPAGNASTTVTVTPIDDAVVDPEETIQVVLQGNSIYTINGGSAVVTIFDDEPVVSISATDPNAAEEGPDQAQFTVSRTGSLTNSLVVNYTVSGSADYGTNPDYTGLPNIDAQGSGWVTIPAGSSSTAITITPAHDVWVESSETVILTLSTNASYPIRTPGFATATITDNDVLPMATNVTASPDSDSQISLTWTDNAVDELGYRIERRTDSVLWTEIGTVGANATSYVDSKLAEGTAYYYRVTATKGAFSSAGSLLSHATTLPKAPTTLAVTLISGGQASLSWEDQSSAESGYSMDQWIGGMWQEIQTANANATSQTISGTYQPSTEYRFRVRASATGYFEDLQYSLPSNVVDVTAPAWPAAPSGLQATAASDTQIDLTWSDNATDETGYKVEWSSDGTNWSSLVTVPANQSTHSHTGLTEAKARSYRVAAINSAGQSGYSDIISAVTLPGTPANLAATFVNGGQVNLTWNDNSLIEAGYLIEQSVGDNWQEVKRTSANAQSSLVNGTFEPATQYSFRVKAFADTESFDAASAPSNVASATTLGWPLAPSNFSTTVVSNSQIDLSWTDNATNETAYQVERTSDGVTWTLVATLGSNATSYSNTGLTDGTLYVYRVQALNVVGGSGYGNDAAATLPTAPTNFQVTVVSGTQMDLSWDAAPYATGYTIAMQPEMEATWQVIGTVPASQTTFSATGLTPGGKYYAFTVRPTNSTAYSAVAYFDPPTANQPPGISGVTAGANPLYGTSTTLSVAAWDDQAESNLTYSWSLVSGPASAYFSINNTNAAKNTTVTFYAAGNFIFNVTVTDAAGASVNSNWSVTVNQQFTSVKIIPPDAAVVQEQTRQFAAKAVDQFGDYMTNQPTFSWSVGGVGTISSSGLYTAPATKTNASAAITAAASGKSGKANVAVKQGKMTVDFNDFPAAKYLGNGQFDATVVTNQFDNAGVKFTADAGKTNIITFPCCGSDGNSIGTLPMNPDPQRWNNGMTVEFTPPVSNLTFSAIGDDNSGNIGTVQVQYGNGLAASVNIQGDGNGYSPPKVDLTAYNSVKNIKLGITDPYGLWWDDFKFDAATLLELRVRDFQNVQNEVIAIDAAIKELYVPEDMTPNLAKLNITAVYHPNTTEVSQRIHMSVRRSDGLLVYDDTFGGGNTKTPTLPFTNQAKDFTVQAWIDKDSDGQLDAGEEPEQVNVKVVKPWTAQGTWAKGQASLVKAEADGASLAKLAWSITGEETDATALGNVGQITKGKLIDVTPLLKALEQRVHAQVIAAALAAPRNAGFGGIGSNNALGIPNYELHKMGEAEIKSIFDAPSLAPEPRYHCWGMGAINMARGLIKGGLKPGEFDQLGLLASSFGQTATEPMTVPITGPLSQIPTGALVNMDNHPDYGTYHPGGYWGNEFAIKTANNGYVGWDIPGQQTELQMKTHLRDAFNAGLYFWQQINIADVPGYQGHARDIDFAKIGQRVFALRTGTLPPGP